LAPRDQCLLVYQTPLSDSAGMISNLAEKEQRLLRIGNTAMSYISAVT
jgi:hypothetical protein